MLPHASTSSPRTPMQRLLAAWLIALQALSPLLYAGNTWAQTAINPDRSRPGARPIVNVTGNGVPVVQIAPPSKGGVSNNRFTDYNVGPKGVILNNSGGNSQTQLGGWIGGNPMLGNGGAKTILNQVTGNAPTSMAGYTEVAGKAANVIVANPNGITCDGCGFINTPRATLTTGTPQLDKDGSVRGFDVRQGQIQIDGMGMDAGSADRLDLISRSLRVNANIWARRLEATTGAAQVNYENGRITRLTKTGKAPAVALDVSQLGGMYANSIRLIGTERGVGVNNAGVIAALTGKLELTQEGDIRIAGSGSLQAKGDLSARSAQQIANSGTLYAEGRATLDAAGTLNNTGVAASAGNLSATANDFRNSGQIAAGVDGSGKPAGAANIAVSADRTLQNSGQLWSGKDIALSAGIVTLDQGQVSAAGRAGVTSTGALGNRNGILQGGEVQLSAAAIDNTQGSIVQTGSGAQKIAATGLLDNTHGTIASNAGNLTIRAGTLGNVEGSIAHAGDGVLDIQANGTADNTGGDLSGNGAIKLAAARFDNGSGKMQAGGDLALSIGSDIDNRKGMLSSQGRLTASAGGTLRNQQGAIESQGLDLRAQDIANTAGTIQQLDAARTASITATGTLDNAQGKLLGAGKTVTVSAATVDNQSGTLGKLGEGSLAVHSNGDLDNRGGVLLSEGTLQLDASRIGNSQHGLIQSSGSATLAASGDVDNHGGTVSADTLALQAGGMLDNHGGALVAAGTGASSIRLGGTLNNLQGGISANGNLALTAAGIDGTQGQLTAGKNLSVTTGNAALAQSVLAAGGTLSLHATGAADVRGASVQAQDGIDIHAATIDNRQDANGTGGRIAVGGNGALVLDAAQGIDNAGGFIGSNGSLALTAGEIGNAGGTLYARGDLGIDAARFDNTNGVLQADANATIRTTDTLVNAQGLMQASRFDLQTPGLDNTSGKLLQLGTADTVLSFAGALDNSQGVIAANGANLTVQAAAIDNGEGTISHAGNGTLTVRAGGMLDNGGGKLQTAGDLVLAAQDLGNQVQNDAAGLIQSGKTASIAVAGTWNNAGGTLYAKDGIAIDVRQLNNTEGGSILGDGNVGIVADTIVNAADGLLQGGSLQLSARDLANAGSILQAGTAGDTQIRLTGTLANSGTLGSNGANMTVAAQQIDNSGGAIRHAGTNTLTVSAANAITNDNGAISGNGNTVVNAATLSNTGNGLVEAVGALTVDAGSLLDNSNGTLQSKGALNLAASAIKNASGLVNSEDTLTLSAPAIDNTSGTLSGARIAFNALESLGNAGGDIVQTGNGDLDIVAAHAIDNAQGFIGGNGNVRLDAASLANNGGTVRAAGTGTLTVDVDGLLDNTGGQLAAGSALHVSAASMDNRSGRVESGENLAMAVAGNIDNRSGSIAALGNAAVNAATLDNRSGTIGTVEGALAVTTTGQTDNTGGKLLAGGDLGLNAAGLVNAQGTIAGGNVQVNTQNQTLNNAAGQIGARGTLGIQSGKLDNTGGLVQAAGAVTVDTHGKDLVNAASGDQGGIVGQNTVSLTTAGLDNHDGFISAKEAMTINAAGSLVNTQGGLLFSEKSLSVTASSVDNTSGQAQAKDNITLALGSGTLNNKSGLIRSGAKLTVNAGTITNTSTAGTDQGLEGTDVALTATTINNSGGSIHADNALTLGGTSLNNSNGTISSAGTLVDNVASTNNTGGTLIAATKLTVNSIVSGAGSYLSAGDLEFNYAGDYNNISRIAAGGDLVLTSGGTITNSGEITSGKTLDLTAVNLNNQANAKINATTTNITVSGTLNNRGLIDGTTTKINAGTLNNTDRIYGNTVSLKGKINNTGDAVIASRGNMTLEGSVLNNKDGGTIMSLGDMTIKSTTVNNGSSLIESEGNMTISSNAFNNTNDTYAASTRVVKTEQIKEYRLEGEETSYTEDQIDLTRFDGAEHRRIVVDNAKYPFAIYGSQWREGVTVVTGDQEQGYSTSYRYSLNDPIWALFKVTPPKAAPADPNHCSEGSNNGCSSYYAEVAVWQQQAAAAYGALQAKIDDFNTTLKQHSSYNWYEFTATRTTTETVVTKSDPGRVIVGGNLKLNGGTFTNDKSQIIVGGSITGNVGDVVNIDGQGTRTLVDNGTMEYVHLTCCNHHRDDPLPYTDTRVETIPGMAVTLYQDHANTGNPGSIGARGSTAVGKSASGAANVNAQSGTAQNINGSTTVNGSSAVSGQSANVDGNQLGGSGNTSGGTVNSATKLAMTTVGGASNVPSASQSGKQVNLNAPRGMQEIKLGKGQLVRSVPLPNSVPGSALYKIRPQPGSRYLVETDPAFADYKTWLSSDFMLQQLGADPAKALKRLGDGFYEQKLVADQIMAATGQRYVGDYTSNEEQYKALMEAGVAFAEKYHLTVGTALTPEQMAKLTGDIVWLVKQDVTLADGSVQTVLVPQVYVQVKEGSIKGDGTLIAANDIDLTVGGKLDNNALIASRNLLDIDAGSIVNRNGGRLQGDTVDLFAKTDLDNLSATISGNNVTLGAGRDINIRTNTIDTAGLNTTRTGLDLTAGVDAGNLTISAGRNLNIAGANIDASGNAALSAGKDITIGTVETSSTLKVGDIDRTHFYESETQQAGSHINAGNNLTLTAGTKRDGDLTMTGSDLTAGKNLNATATNITIASAVNERDLDQYGRGGGRTHKLDEHLESTTGGQVKAGGNIVIAAVGSNSEESRAGTGNLTLIGANIASEKGTVTLTANNDVLLDEQVVENEREEHSTRKSSSLFSKTSTRKMSYLHTEQGVGSTVTGDSIAINAGHDVTIKGSTALAQSELDIVAKNDVNILAGETKFSSSNFSKTTTSANGLGGFIGKNLAIGNILSVLGGGIPDPLTTYLSAVLLTSKSAQRNTEQVQTLAVGSVIEGNNVSIVSGKDTKVMGSTVVADADIGITAGRNLTIGSAEQTQSEQTAKSNKVSGFVGDFLQPAIGVVKQDHKGTSTSTTQIGSQIVSLGTDGTGGVTLRAGDQYTQTASQVLAPKGDIGISGKSVTINAADDTTHTEQRDKYSKTAIGGSVSVPLLNAAQSIYNLGKTAKETSDGRMQALAAITAGMQAQSAVEDTQAIMNGGTSNLGGIKVSVSLGHSSSKSSGTQTSSTAVGSTVAAGGNVTIRATGDGKDSDIKVTGSDITAGKATKLEADGDIVLQSAVNTYDQHSKNSSSGASIGVGFAIGGQQQGFTIDAGVSVAKGKADGTDVNHTNTHIAGGDSVTLISGGDTTLRGAVVKGDQVIANVGGDLKIESEQDTSKFDSKQSSAGIAVSLCIPPFCVGASTVSGSIGQSNIDSTYASVTEQSGIVAGDNGFVVSVNGNTDLKGGVISSSDKAVADERNVLVTGTLTTSDIKNHASYSGNSIGLSASYSTGTVKNPDGSNKLDDNGNPVKTGYNGFNAGLPSVVGASGDADSITKSGISEGILVITDEKKQEKLTGKDAQETVASINRDTSDTTNSLKPIFDEKEIKAGFEIVNSFTAQMSTFLETKAKEADQKNAEANDLQKKADDPNNGLNFEQRQDLRNQAAGLKAEAANITADWGAQGTYRRITTALTAAVGSNITGGITEFAQNAVVNLIQEKTTGEIKQLADDLGIPEGSALHAALHAINACAGAAAKGNKCSAGALGAASSSVINAVLTGSLGTTEDLTEEQKQARETLVSTLVTGIASQISDAKEANTAALIEMENNSNVKNAVKAAIKDAKVYLGDKAKQGGEQLVQLLERIEIKALKDKQLEIAAYLDSKAAQGGLSEAELVVFATLYAANEALFPTDALSLLGGGAGKAIKRAGELAKLTGRAEEAAKVALTEVKALEAGAKASKATEFEKGLVNLTPGDRVATVKQTAKEIAESNGWEKDARLSRINGRDVYEAPDGFLYSLDTQHGRWEKINPKTGSHEGEFRLIDQKFVEKSIDTSGKHDLKVK